jgi:cytochrome d ubiquinol oxidase subunit I
VLLCHFAFQLMVGLGTLLAVVGAASLVAIARRRFTGRPLLAAVAACAPLGFVALEAGWVVTEAGRQPWVVQGIMRTADAVTPAHGVQATFAAFTALYLLLAVALVALLRALARHPHAEPEHVAR